MKFEGIIFDWAGTTVDYGCFAPVQAFIEVFKHFGVEPTMEEVRKPMGMLKIDHIRTMLKMDRISRCWQEKYHRLPCEDDAQAMFNMFEEKLMSILENFADLKEGVADTIKSLREMGLKIGSTTGYNDKMMGIVVPIAAKAGYAPDCWYSPDAVGQKGRPYPYMIFKNMETLGLSDVSRVLKVGDTVADILEGKHASVKTAGILEGSSVMGLTKEEYEALSDEERKAADDKAEAAFKEAGADYILRNITELLEIVK